MENHGDPHVSCNQVQTKQTIYYYTIYRRFDRTDISDIGKFLRLNYISDPSERIKGISVEQSRSSRNAALLVLLLVVVFTYSPARPAKRRFIHDWMQILPSLKLKTLPYIALPFTNAYASLEPGRLTFWGCFGGGPSFWRRYLMLELAEPQSAGHSNVQRLNPSRVLQNASVVILCLIGISSCNKKKQRLKSSSSLHEGSYLSVHRPRILSALGIHGRTTLPGHCFPETLRRMARDDTPTWQKSNGVPVTTRGKMATVSQIFARSCATPTRLQHRDA